MFLLGIDNRSDNDYGQSDGDADTPFLKWYEILLFPVCFVMLLVFSMLPILLGIWLLLTAIYSSIKAKIKSAIQEGDGVADDTGLAR